MRTSCLLLACVAGCVLGAAGCYESLTSIATPDKLVFDEQLLGEYAGVAPTAGRLVLERGEGKAYAYRQYDEKNAVANKGTLWVVKLGDEQFYQVSVDGYATAGGKPVYAVGKLRVEGAAGAKVLAGYAFKSEQAIFGDPLVKTEEYEHEEAGQRKKGRAIAMPPEKLQTYLAARAGEMTEPTLTFKQTGGASEPAEGRHHSTSSTERLGQPFPIEVSPDGDRSTDSICSVRSKKSRDTL